MNKLIKQPTQADIRTIADDFTNGAEYYMSLDMADFEKIMKDADEVAILECSECGEDRLPRAFDRIVTEFASLAPDRDIYRSDRYIIQLSFGDTEKLLVKETLAITDFISRLSKDADVVWGIAHRAIPEPHTIMLQLAVVTANGNA